MEPKTLLLGEWLLQRKLLTPEKLELALEEQGLTGDFLGDILVRKKYIGEKDLMKALSEQFQIPYLDMRHQPIDMDLALRFSPALISEHQCLPIRESQTEVLFAITNPLDAFGVSKAEKEAVPKKLRLTLVTPEDMRSALKKYQQHLAAKRKRSLQ